MYFLCCSGINKWTRTKVFSIEEATSHWFLVVCADKSWKNTNDAQCLPVDTMIWQNMNNSCELMWHLYEVIRWWIHFESHRFKFIVTIIRFRYTTIYDNHKIQYCVFAQVIALRSAPLFDLISEVLPLFEKHTLYCIWNRFIYYANRRQLATTSFYRSFVS